MASVGMLLALVHKGARLRVPVLVLALGLIPPFQAVAIQPANVLVLYNAASEDGEDIANYYAGGGEYQYPGVHPGAHKLALTNVSLSEQILADEYLTIIQPQVLEEIGNLQDRIDVIVTTKGLPLRIDAGSQPAGNDSLNWRRYSSLESELTRIDSIDSLDEMGDQFIDTGFPESDTALGSNPYYNMNAPFTYGPIVRDDPYLPGVQYSFDGIRLSARLDGFSVQAVKDAIDRAQRAFAIPFANPTYVIADDDPTAGVDQMVDGVGPGPGLVAALAAHNQPYVYDNTNNAIVDLIDPTTGHQKGSVIGYVSHGTNDGPGGLEAGYIPSQLNFDLAAGAVFLSHESYNAISFDPACSQTQGLVAQWIERGGTAALGHVQEPYNGPDNVTNEDLLFDMLLPLRDSLPTETNLTFVEAAWNATRQLSYVNTVIGDPLMIVQDLVPGGTYLDIIRSNWGQSVTPGDLSRGDLNWDGWIAGSDLDLLRANWGNLPRAVPEPSGLAMLATIGLAASAWRTHLRRKVCLRR